MTNKPPDNDQWVRVYYNFHEDTLSVQNTNGIVIAHQDRVVLREAEFRVQPAGRQRTIEEGVKNVHAKVHGHWALECPIECPVAVRYNPYEDDFFKTVDGGYEIEFSPWCIIEKDRCFIPEE